MPRKPLSRGWNYQVLLAGWPSEALFTSNAAFDGSGQGLRNETRNDAILPNMRVKPRLSVRTATASGDVVLIVNDPVSTSGFMGYAGINSP